MRTVNTFIGSPVERIEDLRFLRGRGQFVDDVPSEMIEAGWKTVRPQG